MKAKAPWVPPTVVVYGSLVEITQQQPIKNKVFGGADDVLVNNQAILRTIS